MLSQDSGLHFFSGRGEKQGAGDLGSPGPCQVEESGLHKKEGKARNTGNRRKGDGGQGD